jgi:protein-S-isoprenylcysteine O-methyltransferase Ste14
LGEEGVFRVALLVLWLCLFSVRTYYAAKLQRAGESVSPGPRAVQEREGVLAYALRVLLFSALILVLLVYTFRPQWMASFVLPLPSWVRWAGVVLGLLCVPFLVWVQHTLGRQWSSDLQLREQHILVTEGPYRWIRHPMYSVVFAFLGALCLVSANWLFLLGAATAMVMLYRRIDKEEQMMMGQFGDEYRSYRARTGRLVPRLVRGRK